MITIGPVKGQGATKFGIYFGDMRSNVYMLDATTGKQIWKVKVEDHPASHITAGGTLYEGRLYIPVSSVEERAAGLSTVYPCCKFRGSVSALDANTGHTIWKTYTIPEAPKPTVKTSKGIQQYGPNGGAVWNSPTIDAKTSTIYIEPATPTLPLWPKPLPNHWILGQVIGVSVDSNDNVWIVHRPQTLEPKESYLRDQQRRVPYRRARRAGIPDPAGNLLHHWGKSEGHDWPASNHGITVDYKGNVWLGGNGSGQPPAATAPPANVNAPEAGVATSLAPYHDSFILKFTQDGKFLGEIGHAFGSKGSNDTENVRGVAQIRVDPKTNELFAADGYGNRRVSVWMPIR